MEDYFYSIYDNSCKIIICAKMARLKNPQQKMIGEDNRSSRSGKINLFD